MSASSANVLIVDDERELADLYATWLESRYAVQTAYGGESALELVDSDTDVVLLDRRMPDVSGDEVLEEIRSRELGCHVAMVTAVEPDFDIIEMGFDDYLVKPVDREELFDIVERLLAFEDLGPGAREYYSKVSKKTALESQKGETGLHSNPDLDELNEGIDVYGGVLTSLAEEAIETKQRELQRPVNRHDSAELGKWKARLESLDPDDALYRLAKERIDELEAELGTGGKQGHRQFLEAIAEDFIAEGPWLDPTVRRAMNLLFYEVDREQFIIDRQPLEQIAQKGAAEKFEVSHEIRDRARKELNDLN